MQTIVSYTNSLIIQIYQLCQTKSVIKIPSIVSTTRLLFTLMMKSVDFETRECFRDEGSALLASLGVEIITHLVVETALKMLSNEVKL